MKDRRAGGHAGDVRRETSATSPAPSPPDGAGSSRACATRCCAKGAEPVLFEQGRHRHPDQPPLPRGSPRDNVRYAYSWIKGAVGRRGRAAGGPSSPRAILDEMKKVRRGQGAAGRRLHRPQHDQLLQRPTAIQWTDGMSADGLGPRHQEHRRAGGHAASSRPSADACHTAISHFLVAGMQEQPDHGLRHGVPLQHPRHRGTWRTSSCRPGPNSWAPTGGIFSDRIIQPGDLVIIDMAAVTWNGLQELHVPHLLRRQEAHRRAAEVLRPRLQVALRRHRQGAARRHHQGHRRGVGRRPRDTWGYEEEGPGGPPTCGGTASGLAQYDTPVVSRIYSLDHPVVIEPGMSFALENPARQSRSSGASGWRKCWVVTEEGPQVHPRSSPSRRSPSSAEGLARPSAIVAGSRKDLAPWPFFGLQNCAARTKR